MKYLVPAFARTPLMSDLRALTVPDAHAGSDGSYRVRTLYFDSRDWMCFCDKIDGVGVRHKLRIRAYPDAEGRVETVKFEVKHRDGQLIRKDAAAVDVGDYRRLIGSGPLRAMDALRLHAGLAPFVRYAVLHHHAPVLTMEYRRIALRTRLGDARVTLDDRLSARRQRDLTRAVRPAPPLMPSGQSVLEVKVAERLPWTIKKLIQKYRLQSQPVSKYALAAAACYAVQS